MSSNSSVNLRLSSFLWIFRTWGFNLWIQLESMRSHWTWRTFIVEVIIGLYWMGLWCLIVPIRCRQTTCWARAIASWSTLMFMVDWPHSSPAMIGWKIHGILQWHGGFMAMMCSRLLIRPPVRIWGLSGPGVPNLMAHSRYQAQYFKS